MPKSTNPATGQTFEDIAGHDDDFVQRALENADRAYAEWRLTSFDERAVILRRVADILEAGQDKYGRLATLEMGKRFEEAKAEVKKCASVCRYYADHAEEFLADKSHDSDAEKTLVSYQPIGLVLAVMPWNFPFWQLFRFAAPNLMAGNVGILKHASNVPQCAMAIEQIFTEAGLPQGCFQTLLIGSDKIEAMIDDERVKAVTLTGSEPAGAAVASQAARQIKKAVLELGGSDAFIVMPSADIDAAIATGIKARLQNNGQSCIAAKRFIVHEDVYDRVLSGFKEKFEAMSLGDPMDGDNDLGPLATKSIRDELADQVDQSVKDGATLVTGGKVPERDGWFYPPTILADIPKDAPAYMEEFFGPVALFFKVKDIDEAIEIANATTFGLSSAAFTKDGGEQKRFIRDLVAGGTFINRMTASDPRVPFGGVKHSGYGRELSAEGIHEFVNIKTVAVDDPAF
ncbi:NADP-dependent succinic semialdehyde dehydrogenase [Notoacmeibacter marinus]|uniref:NADP-dependent succinic semialdehyde dehydrogenase n=1 Tax=Notoacmeibacter marinus TaxID=1876515 RepID=A0A231V5M1_9HYPH|nr:NAD-dependent succinate-semialdehyde dehydrogenase [Notoacmeibacter marinus]OXT02886.1 NADP-dependent succinic semialdehyde dehydrogenase [Notoacmeibacter marinus]